MGVFARLIERLGSKCTEKKAIILDLSGHAPLVRGYLRKYRKAHGTVSNRRAKRGPDDQRGRLIGWTKGGLNTMLHAVTDAKGRPLKCLMTAGQGSDQTGAAGLLGCLPAAEWMLADQGYEADWFREALPDKGIRTCIPGQKSHGKSVRYDKRRYRRRNRSEKKFGWRKDWRWVATRYNRCAKTFLSAIGPAATVMFWLRRSLSLDLLCRR